VKEERPLKWPSGWPRVLPEKQKTQSQWKKPISFYKDQLESELQRMGAEQYMLTMNDPGHRDAGVAVWFSRKRDEDFSWRETLEITAAYPSIEDVDAAYRRLAQKYHPDNASTSDVEIFHKISKAKIAARDWVNRREGNTYGYSLASDTFKEQRLNIAALASSIRYIRGLERCGTSSIMEKTIEGFKALPEKANV
jgi:DnaJ domain